MFPTLLIVKHGRLPKANTVVLKDAAALLPGNIDNVL